MKGKSEGKHKKTDQWIKSWLEWRNQQEQSSGGVL